MISFDFDYYRPSTAEEAVGLFHRAEAAGRKPMYYAGGSEIVSLARIDWVQPGAVIDVKGIPECNVFAFHRDRLYVGAAVTLSQATDANLFPLLGETVGHVADRTNANRITVGGNVCGQYYYREALLPFLLADSHAVLAGPRGVRAVPVADILNGEPRLPRGELLLQLVTDSRYVGLPYVTLKKTKLEYIDYPIVRICGLRAADGIRMAFSGVSAAPFRSRRIEQTLNDASLPLEQRVDNAIRLWPMPILDDILSSAEYRAFVLRNTLIEAMEKLERGDRP